MEEEGQNKAQSGELAVSEGKGSEETLEKGTPTRTPEARDALI